MLDESFEFDPSLFHDKKAFSIIKLTKKDYPGNFCTLSYYLFTKKNPFRLFLYKMHNHIVFEAFIQILILISTIKLVLDAYESSLPSTSIFQIVSTDLNYFITAAFAGEALVKSISLGFIMDKGSYLRDNWSRLDFFIVVTSMIDACFSSINVPFIKVLRLLRVLRALRVVSHNSEMKTQLTALAHSLKGIFYVFLISIISWIIFAILGVFLIGGKLWQCDNL